MSYQSQTNIPLLADVTALQAYAADGILVGQLAVTQVPQSLWQHSDTAPTSELDYYPAARGGYWIAYASDAENVAYADTVPLIGATDVQGAIDLLKLTQASEVPSTRTITAGAGLTGGGDLSANRTLDAVANADGSIVVNANDIQVGILASDAQHGTRGGGSIHANVVAAGAAGFMTGSDKTKLDSMSLSVANIAALPASPVDGEVVFVRTVQDPFVWVASSSLTADGITIITGSGGRWLRQYGAGNATARAQKTWFFDANSGNDENVGTTGVPLKTWAEFLRRVGTNGWLNGGGGVAAPVVITISSALPNTDPITVVPCAVDTHVRVIGGVATTVGTGTFTAVTARDRPNNVPQSVTDSALASTWIAAGFASTTNVFRCRITSGARSGAICYTIKDLGSKACRISSLSSSTPSTFSGVMTAQVPTVNDPYVIETLYQVHLGRITQNWGLVNTATNVLCNWNFEDLDILETNTLTAFEIEGSQTMQVNFYNCIIRPRTFFGRHSGNVFNCWFNRNLQLASGCLTLVYAGGQGLPPSGTNGGVTCYAGSAATFDFDFIIQGGGTLNIRPGSGSFHGFGCTFDSSANGVLIGQSSSTSKFAGANFTGVTLGGGGHQWYGSGNAGKGMVLSPGCQYLHNGTAPVVTGTGGDFQLGIVNATQARAFDETLAIYGALTNCTWTLLGTAYASAGFSGNAHDPAGNAHLLKAA